MSAINWPERWALGGWWEDLYLRRKSFPIGPRNTYSNIAYALAAVYLVVTGSGTTRWVLGAAMLLLAIGSAGYHAFKTERWRTADHAGMVPTMAVLMVHGLLHNSPGLTGGAFMVATVLGAIFAVEKSDKLLGLLFLGAAVPPLVAGAIGPTLIAVALFALAFAFWVADKRAWAIVGLWGHAIWHVLTAVAMPQLHAAQIQ